MGCHECERLRNEFSAVMAENRELLEAFEAAMLDTNRAEIDRLRLAILDIEEKRREARVRLLTHDATHREMAAGMG
jgi:hypothetical protein